MTGSQSVAMLSSTLTNFDRQTQMLASMKNQISSHDIVPVPVAGMQLDGATRRTLVRGMGPAHRAALQAALTKATVADSDRTNGQSEDQSSLADYLKHLGIDPSNVVAVNVDPSHDAQNPRVTVFYSGKRSSG